MIRREGRNKQHRNSKQGIKQTHKIGKKGDQSKVIKCRGQDACPAGEGGGAVSAANDTGTFTWGRGEFKSAIDLVIVNSKANSSFIGMKIDEERDEIFIDDTIMLEAWPV